LPILIVAFLYNVFFPANYLAHLGFKVPKDMGAVIDVEMSAKKPSTSEST
jgi:hypothetical protein